MGRFVAITTALLAAGLTTAQNVTVPSTCTDGFQAGTDTVLYTVPYTYTQVLSIIGNYSNLTWSGSPPGSVKLNGSDNTVGTARTYNIDGAHIIETILEYSKPANGPYVEVHNTALFRVPTANLSAYIPFDGTVVKEVCNGKASQFNFTANFCANNATVGAAVLHMVHLGDAETVGKFLGGQNFTSCAALQGSNSSSTPSSTASGTASSSSATVPVATGSGLTLTVQAATLGAAVFAVIAFVV